MKFAPKISCQIGKKHILRIFQIIRFAFIARHFEYVHPFWVSEKSLICFFAARSLLSWRQASTSSAIQVNNLFMLNRRARAIHCTNGSFIASLGDFYFACANWKAVEHLSRPRYFAYWFSTNSHCFVLLAIALFIAKHPWTFRITQQTSSWLHNMELGIDTDDARIPLGPCSF